MSIGELVEARSRVPQSGVGNLLAGGGRADGNVSQVQLTQDSLQRRDTAVVVSLTRSRGCGHHHYQEKKKLGHFCWSEGLKGCLKRAESGLLYILIGQEGVLLNSSQGNTGLGTSFTVGRLISKEKRMLWFIQF